VKMWVWI